MLEETGLEKKPITTVKKATDKLRIWFNSYSIYACRVATLDIFSDSEVYDDAKTTIP